MLDTSKMEEVYNNLMNDWLGVHADVYWNNQESCDRCDMCRKKSTGILYNVPGDGCELLVCYTCYIRMSGQLWRES